jgi:hypothetical protein
MRLFKKGDLTFRYIVLMVLGLMVLVVIIMIFLKGSGYFVDKLKTMWAQVSGFKPNLSKSIIK